MKTSDDDETGGGAVTTTGGNVGSSGRAGGSSGFGAAPVPTPRAPLTGQSAGRSRRAGDAKSE
jgi:hypothetical protein